MVDGNDADAVLVEARRTVERARAGQGPSLVEALTYRHGGHSRADPGKYRPADEIEAWMERDPIPSYHQRLLRLGVEEGRLSSIQQDVARRVDEAAEFAIAGEVPGEELLLTDVWADGGWSWRN
jgi:pyruvate dehydrogenase E1 component alpha subunit